MPLEPRLTAHCNCLGPTRGPTRDPVLRPVLLRPNPVHDPSAALAKAPMTIDAFVVNMVMDRTTRARNILPLERGRLCLSRPTVATRNS